MKQNTGTLRCSEEILLPTLFAIMLVLRIMNVFNYRFDSDEPQHLHVVWAWVNGMLQYRDVFDNHAPLFHVLCAPVLALFGERADILIVMRLFMVPLYLVSLWCIYHLGTVLYSKRIGLWAALFASLWPRFFLTATEFRADDLWVVCWFFGLVVLVSRRATMSRLFLFGLILGTTFAVSFKTLLLLGSVGAAAGIALAFKWHAGERIRWLRLIAGGGITLVSLCIVPVLVALFFYWHGAFREFYYGTIQHNIVPNLKRSCSIGTNILTYLSAVPFLLAIAAFIFRRAPEPGLGVRRSMIFLVPGFYFVILFGFWPDVTRESLLPLVPLAVLICTPALLFLADWLAARMPRMSAPSFLALLVVGQIAWISRYNRPWCNRTHDFINMTEVALKLTKQGEYVMDGKAGVIYRPRPFFYALETVTLTRLRRKLIRDDIAERLIATRTAVLRDDCIRPWMRGGEFIRENYLPILKPPEELCVLGKMLQPADGTQSDLFSFDVAVPERYVIVGDDGPSAGTLDGAPLNGSQYLEAGHHEFRQSSGSGHVALFWARALENGYLPCALAKVNSPSKPSH